MVQYQDIDALRQHVDNRLDNVHERLQEQDRKLDQIIAAFNTSRFVVRSIAWMAAVGAGVAVMWANFHFIK